MIPPREKRQHRRVPLSYQVKLVADDRIIAYPQAIDLSMSGVLLDGRDLLPEGTQCGIAILVEAGGPGRRVVARGHVVRSDARGLAIAFTKALDPTGSKMLSALIQSLLPEGAPDDGSTQAPPEPTDGAQPGR